MILEWEVPMTVEFPDDDINRIVAGAINEGWTIEQIKREINEVVMGFDDSDYYAWGEDQTKEVINEIKRRMGGVQLSMFNDPFGVPEDYNEGWQ